jgi:hypothetical protein
MYKYDNDQYMKDKGQVPIYDYNRYLKNKKYYDTMIKDDADKAYSDINSFTKNNMESELNYPGKDKMNIRTLSNYLIPTIFAKKHCDHKNRISALNSALNHKVGDQYPDNIQINNYFTGSEYDTIARIDDQFLQEHDWNKMSTRDKHFSGSIKVPEKQITSYAFCNTKYVPQELCSLYEKFSSNGSKKQEQYFNLNWRTNNMHHLFDLIASDLTYFVNGIENDNNNIIFVLTYNKTPSVYNVFEFGNLNMNTNSNSYCRNKDSMSVTIDMKCFLGG